MISTEFNDGNRHHYVTDPDVYVAAHRMYEMRACSAYPKDGYRMYVDPQFESQRRMLQPRLEACLYYQFPWERAGSPEDQARFFCDTIGALRANEMIMLDTESQSGLKDPADFTRRWCAVAESRLDTLAWVYVPSALAGALNRSVTGPRIVKAPRYSGHAGRGTPPSWPYDVWQYTETGRFPGSPHGPGDCNYTDLSIRQLLERCRRGGPPWRPVLRQGDQGPWVTELQKALVQT